jgi:hypothetical protein
MDDAGREKMIWAEPTSDAIGGSMHDGQQAAEAGVREWKMEETMVMVVVVVVVMNDRENVKKAIATMTKTTSIAVMIQQQQQHVVVVVTAVDPPLPTRSSANGKPPRASTVLVGAIVQCVMRYSPRVLWCWRSGSSSGDSAQVDEDFPGVDAQPKAGEEVCCVF